MFKTFIGMSLLVIAASAVTGTPLQVGDIFPSITGQTVSGAALELPEAGAGSAQVVVFSFSRAGGSDARLWNERLAKDFGIFTEVSRLTVIMLESVPKLFRGAALSNIKGNVSKPLWEKTMLVFKDEALWKSRLGVSTDGHCYVVVLDKASRVAWMGAGQFTEKQYAGLQRTVMGLIASGKQGRDMSR